MTGGRETVEVEPAVFRAVYDSPASLPGRHRWTTPEADVRRLEKLLNMPARSIGAPLWVSGDEPDCPKCGGGRPGTTSSRPRCTACTTAR